MTAATEPTVTAADPQRDIPEVPIYRLSVAQYRAMARAGILDEDAPVELLEGWLVQKRAKHRPYSICLHQTRRTLEQRLPWGWYVSIQDPISVYWIVNLKARKIEVYTDPTSTSKGHDYRRRQLYGAESAVEVILEGVPVGRTPVREILPRAATL